jgi:hypothetical protein
VPAGCGFSGSEHSERIEKSVSTLCCPMCARMTARSSTPAAMGRPPLRSRPRRLVADPWVHERVWVECNVPFDFVAVEALQVVPIAYIVRPIDVPQHMMRGGGRHRPPRPGPHCMTATMSYLDDADRVSETHGDERERKGKEIAGARRKRTEVTSLFVCL